MTEKLKVSAGTIARTIILVLALINQALTIMGKPVIEIADEQITQLVNLMFTVVAAVMNWWYNQSFTQAALQGDVLMNSIKEEERRKE